MINFYQLKVIDEIYIKPLPLHLIVINAIKELIFAFLCKELSLTETDCKDMVLIFKHQIFLTKFSKKLSIYKIPYHPAKNYCQHRIKFKPLCSNKCRPKKHPRCPINKVFICDKNTCSCRNHTNNNRSQCL